MSSEALRQLVGVRHRNAVHDPLLVVVVVAHAPECGAVHVDRDSWLAAGMPDAVDVRRGEVEAAARPVLARPLPHPAVVVSVEGVLAEHPGTDVDGARGLVVVVIAGVLRVVPADQPDVDARIAVELCEVALVRVVPDERLPDVLCRSDRPGERSSFLALQRARAGGARLDQLFDRGHRRHRFNSLSELVERTAPVTASPNDRTTSSAGSGSTIGMSVPKSIGSTPNVDMVRSRALRPYDAVSNQM